MADALSRIHISDIIKTKKEVDISILAITRAQARNNENIATNITQIEDNELPDPHFLMSTFLLLYAYSI